MRTLAAACLVLLAGCVGQAPTPTDTVPPGPAVPVVVPWDLQECAVVMAVVAVPLAAVADRAPSGFTVQPTGGAGPAETTSVGIEAFRCAGAMGVGGLMKDVPYGGLWLLVEPPEDQRVDGAEVTFLRLDFLVVEDAARAAFEAAGAPVYDGDATATIAGGPGVVEGTLTMEGVGTYRLRGLEVRPRTGSDGFAFAEYAPATNGVVVWSLDWDNAGTTAFRGVVDLPAGSWLAEALRATTVPADIEVGTWSFAGNAIVPR